MLQRPRRNRQSAVIRDMVEETRLSVKDMLFPLFVQSGTGKRTPIVSMPGIYRYSQDLLLKEMEAKQFSHLCKRL